MVKVFGSGGDIVVVMVVVVLVMVVGYCGAVFVVVAVTHVIRLIESDSFIISLVYSLRGGGCGGCLGVAWVVFVLMVVIWYWWWCGGDIVVVVTAFVRVAVVVVVGQSF